MENNELVSLPVAVAFKFKKPKESFTNKLICWWTKSKYYHVELILGDKWISSNPDVGGVTIRPLEPLRDSYEYCKLGKIEITKEQSSKIMKWISSQSDKKYDWVGIFLAQVLPLRFQDDNKWYCSEIVTTILKFLLVEQVMNLDPGRTSPGDLARKLNFNG